MEKLWADANTLVNFHPSIPFTPNQQSMKSFTLIKKYFYQGWFIATIIFFMLGEIDTRARLLSKVRSSAWRTLGICGSYDLHKALISGDSASSSRYGNTDIHNCIMKKGELIELMLSDVR